MSGNLHSDAYDAFADLLRAMREDRGVTQADLACRVGRPQSFVSKSERKQRRIDVVEFIEITAALGILPERALVEVRQALAERGLLVSAPHLAGDDKMAVGKLLSGPGEGGTRRG